MKIDRCYCYQTTFEEIHDVADSADAWTVEDLQEHVTFGLDCRLCHPYVRRMLRTGQTVFHEIVEDDDEP